MKQADGWSTKRTDRSYMVNGCVSRETEIWPMLKQDAPGKNECPSAGCSSQWLEHAFLELCR